jgi:hypothetical protein
LFRNEVTKGSHEGCESIALVAALAGEKRVLHKLSQLPVPQASAKAFQAMVNFGECLGGFNYVSSVEFMCAVDQRGEIALERGERYQQWKSSCLKSLSARMRGV